MAKDLLEALAAVASLAFLVFVIGWMSKRHETEREKRRFFRKFIWLLLLSFGAQAYVAWARNKPAMVLPWGVILLLYGWPVLRRPGEEDAQRDYAHDPRHCGRCGYDLTGNVSGTCPECGWRISALPMLLERPDWGIWWRQWPIEFLEKPRHRLASAGVFALVFLGMTVWFAVFKRTMFAVVPAIVTLGLSIRVVRILAYLKRQRKRSSKE